MRIPHPLTALLVAACASCAPQFMIAAQYGPRTAEGDIGVTSGSGAANAQNSLEDLGLDEAEGAPGLAADFKWGMPHLMVAHEQMAWDGSGILTATYGSITAGTPVDSEADLGLSRALLTFDLIPTDLVELGLGFGVSLIDLDAEVVGGGNTENVDETIPVPVLALRGGVRVWRIDLLAVIAGMSAQVDGDDATYLDADLSGRFALFGEHGGANGSLILGWRRIDFDAEYDDGSDSVDADLTVDGPYLGLQIGI